MLIANAQELIPIEVYEVNSEESSTPIEVVESEDPIVFEIFETSDSDEPLEVLEDNGIEVLEPEDTVEILVDELPGAPDGTQIEEPEKEDKKDKDKVQDKWDAPKDNSHSFVLWIKERLDSVPKHSGYDIGGVERAISYLEKLDNEISRTMRSDLDGLLDANQVEEIRSQIYDGIDRLKERADKIRTSKKGKKSAAVYDPDLVKQAQKITGVKGTFVVVPLLISRLGRIIINGTVSAGHDSSEMFEKLSKKYKLTDREQAELMQFLSDAGFPLRSDRGYNLDEEYNISSSDNFDWAASYKA